MVRTTTVRSFHLGVSSDKHDADCGWLQALIVQGQNVYEPMGTMVCSITPKIGTYRVDYGYRGAVSAELITSIPTVDAGFIGYTAVQALLGTFGYSQGYTSNSIGNEIIAVYDSITNREGKSQSDAFAEIMVCPACVGTDVDH